MNTVSSTFIFAATTVASEPKPLRTLNSKAILQQALVATNGQESCIDSTYWLLLAVELDGDRTDKQPGIRQIVFQSRNGSAMAKASVEAVKEIAGMAKCELSKIDLRTSEWN